MIYISKKDSNVLKGILIICIVLGHLFGKGHYLHNYSPTLFSYLYSFHVYIFFILPFFYNVRKNITWENINQTIIRCWIPYLVFFFILMIGYRYILTNNPITTRELLYCITNAEYEANVRMTGFGFMWFLPAFCATSILKLIYDNSHFIIKAAIFSTSILFVFNWQLYYQVMPYIPFGFAIGFYYFYYAEMARIIGNLFANKINLLQLIAITLFIAFTLLFFLDYQQESFFYQICKTSIPIIAYFALWRVCKWISNYTIITHFFETWGILSLNIYLINMIIINLLERIVPLTPTWAIIYSILTFVISYYIASVINKNILLHKFITPRNWSDFYSLFCEIKK